VRIAIAGGGVIGLLTAISCVSAGHEVVLVDQAGIPSSVAASCDRHRVLRALHPGDPQATAAAIRAHHQWIGMQRLLSATFYEQAGALTVLAPEHVPAALTLLRQAGGQARGLHPGALAASYPQLRFPAGMSAVFEPGAGVLLAERVLAASAGWLRRHPRAELRPFRPAVAVDADNATIEFAGGEVVRAEALLVAAGPWSRALLPKRLAGQLVLRRQSMLYGQVPPAAAAAWSAIPPIRSLGTDGGTWLVPPVAGTPLKISAESACRVAARVEGHRTPPAWREHLIAVAASVIPGFGPHWVTGARDCYYLERSGAAGPMLALLAGRAFSYAACGGSSFKFAPLIAQSLAERLSGADPAPTGLHWIDGGIVPVPSGASTRRRQARPVMRGVS
jgi:sarcosine oxidase